MSVESVPAISVVMPIYNAEPHLQEMLDCLAGQTFKDFEVIMVDDGSTDNSGSIAKECSRKDPRFKYFRQKNAGAAAARNVGIERSLGAWLIFVDSDDVVDEAYLKLLHEAVIKSGADVCECRSSCFDSDTGEFLGELSPGNRMQEGTYSGEELSSVVFQKITSCPWDKIIRGSLIRDAGLRFQNLAYSNDTYFVLMCALSARSITYIDDDLVHYRVGLGSSLRDSMAKSPLCDLEMLDALRSGCANQSDGSRRIDESLDEYCVSVLYWSAILLASQSQSATKLFLQEYRNTYLPRWRDIRSGYPYVNSLKITFEEWALTSISPRGFEWAVGIYNCEQIRSAQRRQMMWISLRLLFARFLFGGRQ